LIIGCSAPLTGPLATAGEAIQLGALAAFNEINTQGGIGKRPVHLTLIDDGYVPDRSVVNVKQLLGQSEVLALMNCVGTPNNAAITPLIEASDILHLAPLTGAASLRKPDVNNVYHVRAGYNDEVGRLVDNLVDMHLNSLAIVYLDNGFGKELHQVSIAALTQKGLKAVAEVPIATDGKNLDAVVKAVLASRPSAMLLFTAGTASSLVVNAIREQSQGMPIAGLSVTFSSAALKQMGEKATGIATTMVVPDAMSTKVQIVRKYQKAMRAIKSDDLHQCAADDRSAQRGWRQPVARQNPTRPRGDQEHGPRWFPRGLRAPVHPRGVQLCEFGHSVAQRALHQLTLLTHVAAASAAPQRSMAPWAPFLFQRQGRTGQPIDTHQADHPALTLTSHPRLACAQFLLCGAPQQYPSTTVHRSAPCRNLPPPISPM
jgi:branched-chain amino acid transport system substrate-binding protein